MNRIYTDISHFRAPYKNWPYLGIGADTAADATPWYKNPLYIGGALAVVAGAYFLMAKPTRKAKSNKRRARMNGHGNYFVVDAPGYYGDRTRVRSSHKTLAAAKKAARRWGHSVVRKGSMTRGDQFLRAYEDVHPVAR